MNEVMRIDDISEEYIARELIKRSKDKDIIYLTDDVVLNTDGVKKLANYIEKLEKENQKKDKVIDLMAEDMATDYHSKEWVINHYMEEIKTECKNKTTSQNKKNIFLK